ncbi:MAG: hypothetical protein LBO09_07350 [Candidatus Peribacteria bacterium]|nr:hypothetical protein [Candidatus Peribacteria bacterium]
MPTGKKGNQIVLIDGTPHGSSVQPLASLREREEEQTKQLQELEEKTLQELTKLTEITEQYKDDPQALKELLQPLYNGNLEDAMNAILQHQITPHHHQRILNLLNAYRYAPLPEKTSKAELQEFLVKEMEADSVSQQATPESGTQLFGEVQSFVKKVSKDKKNLPPFEVLDTLIETVQPALDQPEYLALLLISKYLKAEKMFR